MTNVRSFVFYTPMTTHNYRTRSVPTRDLSAGDIVVLGGSHLYRVEAVTPLSTGETVLNLRSIPTGEQVQGKWISVETMDVVDDEDYFAPVQVMLAGNDPMVDSGIDDVVVWAVVDWADGQDPVKFVSLSERAVRDFAGRVPHPLVRDVDVDNGPHIHYSTAWRDGMGMEGPDCAPTIFHLLSAYLYECETRAESAYQRAMSLRESGQYEEAWEAMDESDRLTNLHTNAKVVVDMAFGDAPRAPIYVGSDEALYARAERIVDEIESETDLYHEHIVDEETMAECREYHDNL